LANGEDGVILSSVAFGQPARRLQRKISAGQIVKRVLPKLLELLHASSSKPLTKLDKT
jgi:hypothetical protein